MTWARVSRTPLTLRVEVTLPDGRRAKIFERTESQCREFVEERSRFEVAPELLSERGDLRSKRRPVAHAIVAVGLGLVLGVCVDRIAVIKDNLGTNRQTADEAERRFQCLLGQIGDDAEPTEKGRLRVIKGNGGQALP